MRFISPDSFVAKASKPWPLPRRSRTDYRCEWEARAVSETLINANHRPQDIGSKCLTDGGGVVPGTAEQKSKTLA
jgi:hypothetical protein